MISLSVRNRALSVFSPFQSDFSAALSSYERALQASAQREVRLLCLHEVGWSHVLLLRWSDAADAFLTLRRESRWSKSFYSYLSSGEECRNNIFLESTVRTHMRLRGRTISQLFILPRPLSSHSPSSSYFFFPAVATLPKEGEGGGMSFPRTQGRDERAPPHQRKRKRKEGGASDVGGVLR